MDFEITPDATKALLDAKQKVILLDVREPWEIQTASIVGSKDIPMGEIPARAHQELDEDEHIIVVCHHGVRSMHVTNWLRQQGFDKTQSMQGGIDAWSRQVDPSIPVY